jgi:hypothetical protein
MRRLFLAAFAIAMLLTSIPAAAITDGEPDNGRHPYVGLVVFYDSSFTPLWRCSGTLLSSTVLLTAGHCTGAPDEGVASAQVWFSDFEPVGNWTGGSCTGKRGYPCAGGVKGAAHTHPNFGFENFPNTSDVGIVTLNQSVSSSTYGKLPKLGFLDSFASKRGQQDITVTVVGYGLKEVKPVLNTDRTRWVASQQITDLTSALTDGYNVRLTAAPGNGTGDGTVVAGGACFGDSGGPVFYGTSNVVVGVNSFVLNLNCKGGDYAFRVDTANAQNFIKQFLGN